MVGWAPYFSFTETETDPKQVFVSFKVTPSNDRVLCIYSPSEHSTRKQLARGHFFEGLQNYMENKSEENERKIMLGDVNCTMFKMDRDGGNKTQRLYRCGSNYVCQNSSWIMDLRIYGKETTKISLSSPTMIDLLPRDPG